MGQVDCEHDQGDRVLKCKKYAKNGVGSEWGNDIMRHFLEAKILQPSNLHDREVQETVRTSR